MEAKVSNSATQTTTAVTPAERKANLEGLLTDQRYLESSRPDPIAQTGFKVEATDTQILITGISDSAQPTPESRRYMVNVFQPSVGHSHFLVDRSGNITRSQDNGISPSTQSLDATIHGLSLNQRVWGKEVEKITNLLTDRMLPELK